MLFKHKHLLTELRKNGRRATAEIISIKTVGEGRSIRALWAPDEDLSSGWIDCLMRLRVIPGQRGEPPFEATAMTRVHTLKYLGGTVPVWYDPENTARVVVDYEADLAGEMDWMADAERLAHRHDQRLGLVWTPLGGDLLPIEVLAEPGNGRVAVKGHLDKLVKDHATAAVAVRAQPRDRARTGPGARLARAQRPAHRPAVRRRPRGADGPERREHRPGHRGRACLPDIRPPRPHRGSRHRRPHGRRANCCLSVASGRRPTAPSSATPSSWSRHGRTSPMSTRCPSRTAVTFSWSSPPLRPRRSMPPWTSTRRTGAPRSPEAVVARGREPRTRSG